MATEYLPGLGHTGFAVIHKTVSFSPRVCGFIDRLAKENIASIHFDDLTKLKKLFDERNYPTGLYLESDRHASKIYALAESSGLSIPKDLSVVGFVDLNFAQMLSPPLTTIRQDGELVGVRVADLMLRRLKNRNMETVHEYVPVTLIERKSTGPAPRNHRPENKKTRIKK